MPALDYYNIQGLDTYDNILTPNLDGQLVFSRNIENWPNGAISKRRGYVSFLGTPDSAQVNALMYYPQQSGTQMFLYRTSGSQFYYSLQGTGAWTVVAGSTGGDNGGTITNGQRMQGAILNNNFITGDGILPTMNTSNGTVFTNTVNAPVGQYFIQYANRIYTTNGTNSILTYSSYGSADNWGIAVPADSSSFVIPDLGAAGPMMNVGDTLVITKTKGKMFSWNQNNLVDLSSYYGPTMAFSPDQINGLYFYINQVGEFSFDGQNQNLLSNSVQRLFYNRQGLGMQGSMFGTAGVGQAHIWNYFATMGTVQDDFTNRPVNNAILNYDYQKDTYQLWSFNDNPTAMLSYIDQNNQKQFIFGNAQGQCFQLSNTATGDNGNSIPTEAVFCYQFAVQSTAFNPTSAQTISGASFQKKWNYWRGTFNVGDECNIQFAFSETFTYQHLKWSDSINIRTKAGPNDYWQMSDGKVEIRFPNDPNNLPRSTFLFIRIYDDSNASRWTYQGCQIIAEVQPLS